MNRLRWFAMWAVLMGIIYGGSTLMVMVLHPAGKHDPKGIPVALFALLTGLIGSLIILRLQGRR